MVIRLSKSVIGVDEQEAVARVLEGGFLGVGRETQSFEQELAGYIGEDVGLACVNSGTAALHLALQACGIGVKDEVLVPSFTYIASFQAISATGAVPIACDVSESTGLLDLEDAGRRITSKTKAVMHVHYASSGGDLDALYAFGKNSDLRVIEDAAHAFGCSYKGRRIGCLGDIVCFSFDGIKNITSGEGGAIVSKDQDVIQRVQDARMLGVERDTEKRYQGKRSWDFDVREQGWRYHMSDVMSAIGRVQLQRFEAEFRPIRIALARKYRSQLAQIPGVDLFEADLGPVVPHIQPIRISNNKRDFIRQRLLERDVEVGIHYKPNHLLTKFGNSQPPIPVSENLYHDVMSLPLHPDVTDDNIDFIVGVIEKSMKSK